MAIYYIDPFTTTNGTGTYASPWSLNSGTRTGLADGDEIRIKGVALTSLLTATSYTATVTSQYQLTLTAGGGLGADWAIGNIGYLPAYDTFFRVYTVTGNVISAYTTTSLLPIFDWSVTSLTVRRVDTTAYSASGTGTTLYIGSSTSSNNNITVSDGWTSASTRVTDGSVKSVITSSSTASNVVLYASTGSSTYVGTGWSVDLSNSHVICTSATTAVITLSIYCSGTYSINQTYGWGTSSGGITLGANGAGVNNTTVNIQKYANYSGLFALNGIYGTNNTVNITNFTIWGIDYMVCTSGNALTPGNTINITNISSYSFVAYSSLVYLVGTPLTLNITGFIDAYLSAGISLVTGLSESTVTFGPSVVVYLAKRTATKTAYTNLFTAVAISNISSAYGIPTIVNNAGFTYTTKYNSAIILLSSTVDTTYLPQSITISTPEPLSAFPSGSPYGAYGGINQVIVSRDGSAPSEILGFAGLYSTNGQSNLGNAIVTLDASVYRTTGPSLKSYLNTRTAALWFLKTTRAVKTIKIPATSGTSYTVAGYIRTDDTSYVSGDCRVSIYYNDAEVVGADISTGAINAWQSFSLTFTAAQTAEYIFALKMYYETGGKSYWLDDLTIS